MALRSPISSSPPVSTYNYKTSASSTTFASKLTIASSTPHQNKKRTSTNAVSSPSLPNISSSPIFTAAEYTAAHIDHDLFISTLERLFSGSSPSFPIPPATASSSFHRRPPVRVAYQGVRGSYCQEAATRSFSSISLSSLLIPCGSTLESPFSALELGEADRAVVPVENSLDGPIPRNLDLLLRHSGAVKIVGEIVLPVNHCLLCLPGSDPSVIRRVVSHPQAISHCRGRLESMNLDSVDEVQNAADFAKFIAEERIVDTAVIGSQIAAEEFGLAVLHHNFQDRDGNFNRFLQLGPAFSPIAGGIEGGKWKTTVAFSLDKGPTDLFQVMWAFESRGVMVSRVDHRPNREDPIRLVEKDGTGSVASYFDYVFVLDVDGREDEPAFKAAVDRVREKTGFLRVLGSYATCEAGSC